MKPSKELKSALKNAEEIKHTRGTAGKVMWHLGKLLAENRNNEYWKLLGHESFACFLEDPDIGIKQPTAYAAMKLYETFEFEIVGTVPYNKLLQIVPHIKEENKDELINKAKSLSLRDLALEFRDEKKNDGFEKPIALPEFYRCKDCGLWKIIIDESELCKCQSS